ncbi:ABC transporter substrate-binding protein [Amycolatopsis echigonensis]|uniref:ABC transporter substrate-binding protein n=1 Tax=Amycolatopsis echigonensis TaxID=2576905 RepID=A0A2N3WRA5_9PSEU|nr:MULTISPECIES: ABC transporter substrate-binding protein [Amycolatopsis]MBB2505386.1 ABC transporter substrate-binding protein [Amycolatopsis echigonensis]PKV96404.1 NitT/TauT family transport system substrate-binding protein [Amycolatopsis niigatensis]
MSAKKLAAVLAAALLAVAGCASTASQNAGTSSTGGTGTPVSIMVGGLNKQIYLPFMLAQRLGYYQKQGLNVTLQDEGAGVDATTNMIAGKVDGVGGFYDHTIAMQGLGQSLESVVSMLTTPGEVELCRPEVRGQIHSPADWAGRNLGVTDLGSSTDFLTQYLAQKNGVDPAKIHRVGVQSGATLIGALQHGNVDCAMTTEPTVSTALAQGAAFILLDMRSAAGTKQQLGGEYPATSLYMTTKYVDSHPDVVQKLVNAYVEALKWIQEHNGAQLAEVMPADYYAGPGKDAYAKAFDNEKGIYNPTGIMPPDGPKTNLAVLQAFNPDVKGKQIDLAKTYTDRFVKAAH